MQLIKRTTLIYQQGSSDKIYEIDLCQLGDRYVVNFRYGKRGTTLKEGAKTIQPVAQNEAQKVFDKLVETQIQKGYYEPNNRPINQTVTPAITPPIKAISNDARHAAILNCLANRGSGKWNLDRAIWRAGELKIREATPLLIQLIGTGEPLRDYCIAWALGWCGDNSAIAPLQKLTNNSAEFIRRIAWEALYKLSDTSEREVMKDQKIAQLPPELRDLAQQGTAAAFTIALKEYLTTSDYQRFAVLDTIYQIDNNNVRPTLLDTICDAPFKPNYFQRLRHIFKIAEYRHDGEVFGIFAYGFEKEPGTFDNTRTGSRRWDAVKRKYIRVSKQRLHTNELKSPQSTKAYSQQTREYLRRRVWRTLKQLGEENDSNYINLAVSVLLQYVDADAAPVRQVSYFKWNQQSRRRDRFTINWDAYASYGTFNHILYEHSQRYIYHPQAWRCSPSYQPGDKEPTIREEAFPELWQKHPAALLQLLIGSECRPVHQFAIKALRSCPDFYHSLNADTTIKLLSKPYEVTAELGFELALTHYNPTQPNIQLVLAVANCILQNARTQAYRWIEAQREYFLTSANNLIAGLVTSNQAETRTFARRLLSSTILNDATAKLIIGQIIALLLAIQPTQTQMAQEIGETLLLSFTLQLRSLGFNVILDLLQHPMPAIQELGARILLNHDTKAADLPPDLIESLLASPHESVRGIGIRLFGQLPDEKLLNNRTLLVAMAINAVPAIRQAIRPVIKRLADNNAEFAIAIALDLILLLLTPESHDGVHQDLVQLLREDLLGALSSISKDTTMQLIRAKSALVQELGGIVLQANSSKFLPEFSINEIVKLASHEIVAIREAARQMFQLALPQIRCNSEQMRSAVRLLESKWDDSREFATTVFTTEFTAQDWTPEVMVSICDSVREDVRKFGRDLVTRNFQESFGQEYLLKLSEHPSADMQVFVTNYLENYGADNPERLRELTPYFIRVLCSVNRGRVAKQRIFTFLETEAQKSETAAQIVAEILTRQSATIAIGDKAAALQIMLKLHKLYPQIPLPITIKPVVEVR
jgi:predicted DNA-binding WGR domain protein